MAQRAILHVDMDAFFAALEVKANPSLRGKPLAVCGGLGGRGVVCTASYEARKFGLHSAMPVAEAKRRCPHGIFIEGDHKKYLSAAHELQVLLLRHTPLVEPSGIDEAYLDCSGDPRRHGEPRALAHALRDEIGRGLGVPCSVGLAPNKLLAKMASELAKPGGVCCIDPEQVDRTLGPLSIRCLPGVGQHTAARLEALGIHAIGQLALLELELLEQVFGKHGRRLHAQARGQDDSPVPPYHDEPAPKSLGHEMTFDVDIGGESAVRAALAGLADRVASRLRANALHAGHATLRVRYSDFRTVSRGARLPRPTRDDLELHTHALDLFGQLPPARRGIRLLGLTTRDLSDGWTAWRHTLFDALEGRAAGRPRHERAEALHQAVDHIRGRFGKQAIGRGRTMRR